LICICRRKKNQRKKENEYEEKIRSCTHNTHTHTIGFVIVKEKKKAIEKRVPVTKCSRWCFFTIHKMKKKKKNENIKKKKRKKNHISYLWLFHRRLFSLSSTSVTHNTLITQIQSKQRKRERGKKRENVSTLLLNKRIKLLLVISQSNRKVYVHQSITIYDIFLTYIAQLIFSSFMITCIQQRLFVILLWTPSLYVELIIFSIYCLDARD